MASRAGPVSGLDFASELLLKQQQMRQRSESASRKSPSPTPSPAKTTQVTQVAAQKMSPPGEGSRKRPPPLPMDIVRKGSAAQASPPQLKSPEQEGSISAQAYASPLSSEASREKSLGDQLKISKVAADKMSASSPKEDKGKKMPPPLPAPPPLLRMQTSPALHRDARGRIQDSTLADASIPSRKGEPSAREREGRTAVSQMAARFGAKLDAFPKRESAVRKQPSPLQLHLLKKIESSLTLQTDSPPPPKDAQEGPVPASSDREGAAPSAASAGRPKALNTRMRAESNPGPKSPLLSELRDGLQSGSLSPTAELLDKLDGVSSPKRAMPQFGRGPSSSFSESFAPIGAGAGYQEKDSSFLSRERSSSAVVRPLPKAAAPIVTSYREQAYEMAALATREEAANDKYKAFILYRQAEANLKKADQVGEPEYTPSEGTAITIAELQEVIEEIRQENPMLDVLVVAPI